MEKYMKIAINEAKKAFSLDEVPVGAVIVKDGYIISKAHNKREKTNIVTHHAEILAIEKACGKLKNWRLDDCTLFVTMEPCLMCLGTLIESRIKNIVYGCKGKNVNNDLIYNKYSLNVEGEICKNECEKIIKDFFIEMRNK